VPFPRRAPTRQRPIRARLGTRLIRVQNAAAAGGGIAIRGGSPTTSIVTVTNPVTVTLTGTRQPQAGDVLLIIHGNDFYTASAMPTPTVGGSTTGVTPVTNGSADAGTNLAHIKSYYYVVGSTGDLTVSVTETGLGDEEKSLDVYVLSGVDTTTPIDVAATSTGTTSTSQVAPSISPAGANSYLICHVNTGGAGVASTYTPPAGMTETYDTVVAATYEATGAVLQLTGPGATGTKTFTATGSNPWAALSVAVRTATGGTTLVAGVAAEADTAQPVGRSKTKSLGVAAEADTANVVARVKTVAVGTAVETQSAQAITGGVAVVSAPKRVAVVSRSRRGGGAVATLGVTVGRAGVLPPVAAGVETDTAQPVTARKTKAVGVAAEADTAITLGRSKVKALGIAVETDAAQPVGRSKTKSLGVAAEADTANVVGRSKARTVGVAAETDAAQSIGRAKAKSLGVVGETDTAQPVTARKTKAVGVAAEADTANVVGRSKARTVGVATEVDAAQPVGKRVTVTRAAEADTANVVGRSKARTVGVAAGTDAAITLGGLKTLAIGAATDAETALTVGAALAGKAVAHRIIVVSRARRGGGAVVTSGGGIGSSGVISVGTAVETDTAGVIELPPPPPPPPVVLSTALRQMQDYRARPGQVQTVYGPVEAPILTVGMAVEVDAAGAVAAAKARTVGTALETDAALSVAPSVVPRPAVRPVVVSGAQAAPLRAGQRGRVVVVSTADIPAQPSLVGQAVETDTAQPVTARKTKAVGVAAEADTALSVGRRKARTVGVATEVDAAQPVGKRVTVTRAAETDTARPVTAAHSRNLAPAVETDTGRPLTHLKRLAVAAAAEADAALVVVVGIPRGHKTLRPFTGVTSRPGTGRTVRPFAGVTLRP
jgi:hypothetical protein